MMWPAYQHPLNTGTTYYSSYEAYYGFGRSRNYSRAFKKDCYILPAPVSTPSGLLAIMPPPAQDSTNGAPPNPFYQPYPAPQYSQPNPNMYIWRPPSPAMQNRATRNENNNEKQQGHSLKPEPQFFPAPHPNMYPTAAYPPLPLPLPPPPAPLHPHGVYSSQPLPPGARIISPPRFPTADDLKYKCSICGRFRSSRYHYQHPIPPGELPTKTMCRKCREAATDSDEDSCDSRFETILRRGRSRSRSRATVVVPEPATRRRGRSVSRVEVRKVLPRGRSRLSSFHDRRYVRSYSRSSSLDVEPLHISIDDAPRRRRSPSISVVERVHYIDDPPIRRPALTEEIIYYEEDSRGRRKRVYEDEFYDGDRDYDYPVRTRRISRPATPKPRVVYRQRSDPAIRGPRAIHQRIYYDGPPPPGQLRLDRHVSDSEDSIRSREPLIQQHREDRWYDDDTARGRSHRRYRSRSRSRQSSIVEAPRHPSWLAHAPSPPLIPNSSSLSYIEPRSGNDEVEVTRTTQHAAVDRHGHPATVTRRQRSRSRSIAERQRASNFLQPGDNITVIEKERPAAPVEDYDWYDKDGMRVRVREI